MAGSAQIVCGPERQMHVRRLLVKRSDASETVQHQVGSHR